MKGCFTKIIFALFIIGGISIMYDSLNGESASKLKQFEALKTNYKTAVAVYDTVVTKHTQKLSGIEVETNYILKYYFFSEDTQLYSGVHKGLKAIPEDYFVEVKYAPSDPSINSADIDYDIEQLDDDSGFGLMFWGGLIITILFGFVLLGSFLPDTPDKVNFG